MLAVLGAFISLFIGFFDPWSCFLSFLFCCIYPALTRSIPSKSVVISFLSVTPVPLIQCLYSSKSPRFCGMHGLILSYSHVLPLAWASGLETTALGARLHGPSILRGREVSTGQRIDTSASSGFYDSVRGMPLWGLRPLQGQCRDHGVVCGADISSLFSLFMHRHSVNGVCVVQCLLYGDRRGSTLLI